LSRDTLLTVGAVVNIYEPLTLATAKAIGDQPVGQIQFARRFAVPVKTLALLDTHVLAKHPRACLRETLNGFGAFDDLAFLAHLPSLRALNISGNQALDLGPIAAHGAITDLRVGGLGTSLRPLAGLRSLTAFTIAERVKHLDVIAALPRVTSLGIGGQSLKTMPFLPKTLTSIDFSLGGTRNFEDLTTLPKLRRVTIWRTRQLEMPDLGPLNRIAKLHTVELSQLPRVTSLSWLTNPSVKRVVLENMDVALPKRPRYAIEAR